METVIRSRLAAGALNTRGLVLVGVVFGLLVLGATYRLGFTARAFLGLPTLTVLALAAMSDIQRKTIPDWITLPGLGWVLAVSVFLGLPRPAEAVLGAAVCGSTLLVLAVVSRGSIGGGDVKLMAVVGASLGWRWGFAALFFAQITAALVAGCLLVMGRKGRKDVVPFAPFLSTSAILAFLAKPL